MWQWHAPREERSRQHRNLFAQLNYEPIRVGAQHETERESPYLRLPGPTPPPPEVIIFAFVLTTAVTQILGARLREGDVYLWGRFCIVTGEMFGWEDTVGSA